MWFCCWAPDVQSCNHRLTVWASNLGCKHLSGPSKLWTVATATSHKSRPTCMVFSKPACPRLTPLKILMTRLSIIPSQHGCCSMGRRCGHPSSGGQRRKGALSLLALVSIPAPRGFPPPFLLQELRKMHLPSISLGLWAPRQLRTDLMEQKHFFPVIFSQSVISQQTVTEYVDNSHAQLDSWTVNNRRGVNQNGSRQLKQADPLGKATVRRVAWGQDWSAKNKPFV